MAVFNGNQSRDQTTAFCKFAGKTSIFILEAPALTIGVANVKVKDKASSNQKHIYCIQSALTAVHIIFWNINLYILHPNKKETRFVIEISSLQKMINWLMTVLRQTCQIHFAQNKQKLLQSIWIPQLWIQTELLIRPHLHFF